MIEGTLKIVNRWLDRHPTLRMILEFVFLGMLIWITAIVIKARKS